MLKRIVYFSSASSLCSDADLLAILDVSRRNNARDGVSGLLLFREGNFVQVLEGEAEAVDRTFQRVRNDPRHSGLIVVEDGAPAGRDFGEWSMGYRKLDDPELLARPGFSDFMNAAFPDAGQVPTPGAIGRLLEAFRQRN